tara:strand:+ start:100 stop:411 length:312 start_codon:yes stop_codon:yes gene_type:complete
MSDKLNKKDSYEFLNQLTEKYLDLVWYARCEAFIGQKPAPSHSTAIQLERIERLFPEETNQLKNNEDNWTHGYNSGVLAALRLIENGKGVTEESISEFPNLDS